MSKILALDSFVHEREASVSITSSGVQIDVFLAVSPRLGEKCHCSRLLRDCKRISIALVLCMTVCCSVEGTTTDDVAEEQNASLFGEERVPADGECRLIPRYGTLICDKLGKRVAIANRWLVGIELMRARQE